jgi:hypothetical protein
MHYTAMYGMHFIPPEAPITMPAGWRPRRILSVVPCSLCDRGGFLPPVPDPRRNRGGGHGRGDPVAEAAVGHR